MIIYELAAEIPESMLRAVDFDDTPDDDLTVVRFVALPDDEPDGEEFTCDHL